MQNRSKIIGPIAAALLAGAAIATPAFAQHHMSGGMGGGAGFTGGGVSMGAGGPGIASGRMSAQESAPMTSGRAYQGNSSYAYQGRSGHDYKGHLGRDRHDEN